MSTLDAWVELRHGSQLLDRNALERLPAPLPPPPLLAEHLRTALRAYENTEDLGPLLDVVLEEGLGLRVGWHKNLGAADGEKLLDGTILKPRRRWGGAFGESFLLFTTEEARIGLHRGRRIVAQVTEYLRRRQLSLALLTNGQQWRLIYADRDSTGWVEWDRERWLEAERLTEPFLLFRHLLSIQSLAAPAANKVPALIQGIRDTRKGQSKLSAVLGENVRRAVELLLVSRRSRVEEQWSAHRSRDLYVAACHFIMRLVVLLFAEARELLPVDRPLYHQGYGLRGLLEQLDKSGAERRRHRYSAWFRLIALFRLIHKGSAHPALVLTAYGGELFGPGAAESADPLSRALACLEQTTEPPSDEQLYQMFLLLTRTSQRVREGLHTKTVPVPIDFSDLTSEYIGILYEGLLDYELHRAGAEPVLFLNLGDQPALPLDRLERMEDKAIAVLLAEAGKAGKEEEEDAESEEGPAEEASTTDITSEEEVTSDSEVTSESEVSSEEPDDLRERARSRANAWARRAVVAAGLVKKSRKNDDALDSAARNLVPHQNIKLPGDLYLVRWGGTRKGAGTFYTRPQLTHPTVRRTLEPLLFEEGRIRPPEAILSLKICDPAMGSGSFLVAALRVLTDAVIEALHHHSRVHRSGDLLRLSCDLIPAENQAITEDRLPGIVRRAVVEHCLYGVDLDPLAVELARVALWVETMDRRLPFTFLDHKLRCGNALVGCWFDRFRDYPLLAWNRQSPDEKWRGVHHPADFWSAALKNRRSEVASEQAQLLSGQERLSFAATADAELRAAIERLRALYRQLRAIPLSRPDARAVMWRDRIQADPALTQVRSAFDTWTALWFWPLDQLSVAPGPRSLAQPDEAAQHIVQETAARLHFFHWELEFPDVYTTPEAGFDAVVGNPPWEIQKPSSKEFFTDLDPLYRGYGKQEALRRQTELFAADPQVEQRWLAYLGDFKDRGNFVRNAAEPFGDAKVAGHDGSDLALQRGKDGEALHKKWRSHRSRYSGFSDPAHPFRHQGGADLNSYKMFLEVGHTLLRAGGQLGLIVPSGLYTDNGTRALRQLLLEHNTWRYLYGFENRNKLFDIDSRFKFCVVVAQKGGKTGAVQAAFMRQELEDWEQGRALMEYPTVQIHKLSPSSLSITELRSQEDLHLMEKIQSAGIALGEVLEFTQQFDMTGDSKLFPDLHAWELKKYARNQYDVWRDGSSSVALPVYEGRMIGQFDPSEKRWVSGKGRTAVWEPVPWVSKVLGPQYLMANTDYLKSDKVVSGFSFYYMKISSATNCRTMIGTVLEGVPSVYSLCLLRSNTYAAQDWLWLSGVLNSFVFDFTIRQKLGGLNITGYVLRDLYMPAAAKEHCERSALLVAKLSLPLLRHSAYWLELRQSMAVGKFSPVSALTPHERLRLRAQLDAIIATLYGLSREDYAWILKDCDHPAEKLSSKEFCRQLDAKGFWRVDKDQPPHLRHPVLSFAAFVALEQQIAISGSRDSGIAAFCAQNDGDGWMLPETLCIATLKMTRTVNAGSYDAEASVEQPVASALGPRFLDWQLAQSVEESWAECERHARVILGGEVGQIRDVVKTTEVEKVAEKGKEEKVVVKQQRLF